MRSIVIVRAEACVRSKPCVSTREMRVKAERLEAALLLLRDPSPDAARAASLLIADVLEMQRRHNECAEAGGRLVRDVA